MRKPLFALSYVLLVATASGLEYSQLLRGTLEADPELPGLELAHRRAEVDLELAWRSRDPVWGLSARGGLEGVGTRAPGTTWTVAPEATLEWPQGPRWSLGLPLKGGAEQTAIPTVGLGVPLVSGPDRLGVAELERRVAVGRSRRALRDRRLEVERTLVDRLSALYQAWASLSDAQRKHLAAQADLDRAVALDGATPGAKAYSDGERAVRLAWRDLQRAQAAYRRSQNEVTLLGVQGLSGAPDVVFPASDLGAPLPPVDEVVTFVQANDEVDLAEARAREGRKTTEASMRWGGGYDLSGAEVDLTSGLQWTNEDWDTSLGLGWAPTKGARLELSMSWKPRSQTKVALDEEAWVLERQSLDADRTKARTDALRSLAALERRRQELQMAQEHLTEDLEWARDQASKYRQWRRAGLVTATEVAEVEAVLVSVEAEVVLQRLETMAWNLDRRRLTDERMDHEESH